MIRTRQRGSSLSFLSTSGQIHLEPRAFHAAHLLCFFSAVDLLLANSQPDEWMGGCSYSPDYRIDARVGGVLDANTLVSTPQVPLHLACFSWHQGCELIQEIFFCLASVVV